MTIRVKDEDGGPIRLWIPLLPLYLVLSPLFVLLGFVVLVACAYYRANPLRALLGCWQLFTGLSGFRVEVRQGDTRVLVKIS